MNPSSCCFDVTMLPNKPPFRFDVLCFRLEPTLDFTSPKRLPHPSDRALIPPRESPRYPVVCVQSDKIHWK